MFASRNMQSEQRESYFYDDFNYSANPVTQKAYLWQNLDGTPAASGAYYFSAARSTMATVGETLTDYAIVQGTITLNGTGRSSLMMFSTDAPFTSPVLFLEVQTGTAQLTFRSQTSLTAVGTLRGNQYAYTAVAGDMITALYNPADSTFRGYVNSVERCTWVNGVGTTITVGKGRRHHGLNSNMDSNSGIRWDSTTVFDVKAASIVLVGEGAGSRATGSSTTLATSHSFNVTQTNLNHVLIVSIVSSISTNHTDTGATVTYNGVAMTLISEQHLTATTTSRAYQATYYLFNPPTGNNTVSVTSTGTGTKTAIACQSMLYRGVRSIGHVGVTTGLGVIITGDIRQEVFIMNASNGAIMSTISSPGRMSYTAGSAVTGVGDYIGVADLRSVGGTTTATFGGTATTAGVIVTQLNPT